MIAESSHASQISEILPLGFGACKVQVQVPVSGPIQTVEQLAGGRVATSFEVLGRAYFDTVDARVNAQAADGQEKKRTSIEYVGGSVEAACALGMADGIGEWWGGGVDRGPSAHRRLSALFYSRPRRYVSARSIRL